jgi:hypothetical protein
VIFEILDSSSVATALKNSSKRFYVYVLLRPSGQAFYVGKGFSNRVFHHEAEARNTTLKTHKLNTIRAIVRSGGKIRYALPHSCDDEAEAHAYEMKLIAEIGRHDLKKGPLTNQTDGGEGAVGLSLETMARKAANLGGASDDPERRVANEFFNSIAGQQNSVSIKPIESRRLEPTVPHPSPRNPTERMAKTLVAGCLATGQLLAVGAVIPRMFAIKTGAYVIENGVAKDMLKAGMISVTGADQPEREHFTITRKGFSATLALIPKSRLEDLGVLEPEISPPLKHPPSARR